MGNVNGYTTTYMPNHHSTLGSSGMVYDHILVAEQMLGRDLQSEEVVHHIDKNRSNNSPSNLMVFKTKADHNRFHKNNIAIKDGDVFISPLNENKCIDCGMVISKKAIRCPQCRARHSRIVNRPSAEQLKQELIEFNFVQVGKKYGVSDNAIRKWCKAYGMSTSSKDYKGD